jgi:Kef-type K+ transport system membrane component KefB/nucleotide-binding universal stress UspA family protein
MESLSALVRDEPIGSLALLLAVTLVVPPLFERMRLPGVLGLLASGLLLGRNGLALLSPDQPVMHLLADVGLLYLMFVAGLEIDLQQLRKVKSRAAGLGGATFLIPLLAGILIGRAFQFDWLTSVVLGSLLSSHSLMTYPLLRRLGVVANEAVTVTIGATIVTDIAALIVLAVCLGIESGGFSAARLVNLLLLLSLYTLLVLVGIDRVGRSVFRRSGDDEGNQFLFVLLAVFVAALGAELVGVEKIVGAFLSGLAVNDVVGESPVKEKIVFVGSVLFIPIFFVNIGLLIDLAAFAGSLRAWMLSLAILSALLISKFVATAAIGTGFRYGRREILTMWGMSIPQVATTLAAALVATRVGLFGEEVFNAVVVMMLVTATLGPLVVSRSAVGLPVPEIRLPLEEPEPLPGGQPDPEHRFSVIVPIHNPRTEEHLIELAARIARSEGGRILPLAIAVARPYKTPGQMAEEIRHSRVLLTRAEAFSRPFQVTSETVFRIDDDVPQAINRAGQERQADLIVMGWNDASSLRVRLLGTTVNSVFRTASCPVAVARLLQSPGSLRRILVPVESFTSRGGRMAAFAKRLTAALAAEVTLFHVIAPGMGPRHRAWALAQLQRLRERVNLSSTTRIEVMVARDVASALLSRTAEFELVILHSRRKELAAEGFGFSSMTNRVVRDLTCSAIVIGEAHVG